MSGARASRKALRCAIYTRKSTEEGLEQDFNSLDAQREACAAYVLSQKHEGWSALADRYDDGGYSGGSLERPALSRLLADVEAGKVGLRPDRGDLRCRRGQLRLDHPGLQHHHVDGSIDA